MGFISGEIKGGRQSERAHNAEIDTQHPRLPCRLLTPVGETSEFSLGKRCWLWQLLNTKPKLTRVFSTPQNLN